MFHSHIMNTASIYACCLHDSLCHQVPNSAPDFNDSHLNLILFLILILILILTEDRRRDRAASQGSDPLSAALPVCLTSV